MEEEHTPGGIHPSFVKVIEQKKRIKDRLGGIKNKIGVYSAKGGVGKTTISINLAFTLAKRGFRVGLLDADIDCPNVTAFLGITEKMDISGFPLKPLVKDGVKVASTAMIVDDMKKPIIWRGPIIAKMIGDFLENTDWGDLDYLIIDLPPGTSDAPLSIMQLLDLKGFILVTTPQRVASMNSLRSGLMAKRLNVSILGVVENMSTGRISDSTKDIIDMLGTGLLGVVKFDGAFNRYSDDGVVTAYKDADIAEEFAEISKGV